MNTGLHQMKRVFEMVLVQHTIAYTKKTYTEKKTQFGRQLYHTPFKNLLAIKNLLLVSEKIPVVKISNSQDDQFLLGVAV